MFSIPEQFSNATKANFESQFAIFTSLTNKAFEGVEKLRGPEPDRRQGFAGRYLAAAKQLLSAKDPQEFFSLSAAQVPSQPPRNRSLTAVTWHRSHRAPLPSSAKAAEAQILETNRKVLSLVDEVSKNAPAGTENAVALFKSALGSANAGYEQITKNRQTSC
jgi:hypothetical protein